MTPRSITRTTVWIVAALVLALGAAPIADATPSKTVPEKEALSAARDFSRAFSAVAREAGPAVVFIEVEAAASTAAPQPHGFPFGGPRTQPGPRRGQGSGFLVSADGLLLTNAHVVKDARRINVRMQDGRTFDGTLVGTDPQSDVALVRIDGTDLPFLTMADSDAIEVGEWVVAIGNPFGLRATVTSGIVSAKGRNRVGITDYENFIQTDAAINPGNSGGPLLDLDGQVVGINAAIYSRSGGSMGIGFAIPSNLAMSVQKQLLEHGTVSRGFLGVNIQDLTPELAESFGVKDHKGALIAQVSPKSPADEAGLKAGDVVVSLNGKSIAGAPSLSLAVGALRPGAKAQLRIVRDGKPQELSVTLGRRAGEAEASQPAQQSAAKELGLELAPMTKPIAERLGHEGDEGVLVRSVAPDGPAARAGLRPGALILSVDGESAAGVDHVLATLMRARKGERSVRLRVRDGGGTRFLVLQFD